MSIVAVNTIINSSYNTYGPVWNRSTVNSIDLCNVPWSGQKMVNAFYNCRNLTAVYNMNTNVVNMSGTYRDCQKLYFAPTIPSSVTDLSYTYCNCYNLSTIPSIPPVTTNVAYAFSGVRKMSLAPTIPNSVTNTVGCFAECTGLLVMPVLSVNSTGLENTFRNCTNLSSVGTIPDTVTSLCNTFYGCSNITEVPRIANNITNMAGTFYGCTNVSGKLSITCNNVTNAVDCFGNTSATKNVSIFYYKENGDYTATYNAFTAAGYDEFGSLHGVYLQSADNKVLTTHNVVTIPSTANVYMTDIGIGFGDDISHYYTHTNGTDLVLDAYTDSQAKAVVVPSDNDEQNSVELYTGETMNYKVSANGYTSKTGTIIGTIVSETIDVTLPTKGSSTVDVTDWGYVLNEEDGVVILSSYNGSGAVTVPSVSTQ